MKLFRIFFVFAIGYIFILCFSFQISSCSKSHSAPDTLSNGLVAYYNFNAGSLKDGSGNSNDIILNNNATVTSDRFGHAGNAFSFNGSSSYMEVKNSSSLSPSQITIYAIVKPSGFYQGPCGGNQILSKGFPDDVDGFYQLGFNDESSNCGTINVNNESFSGTYGDNVPIGTAPAAGGATPTLTTGQWYKVAFTYDGVSAKLYVNGALTSVISKGATFTPNNFDLFIGKHGDPNFPFYFNGVIDEIRIYNKALAQGAITELVNLSN